MFFFRLPRSSSNLVRCGRVLFPVPALSAMLRQSISSHATWPPPCDLKPRKNGTCWTYEHRSGRWDGMNEWAVGSGVDRVRCYHATTRQFVIPRPRQLRTQQRQRTTATATATATSTDDDNTEPASQKIWAAMSSQNTFIPITRSNVHTFTYYYNVFRN